MALTYTNIQHEFRKANKLSCLEYVLCDMLFFLSSKDNSHFPGWCYMGKESIAEEIGMTKMGLLGMIKRLITAGFIIKNEKTKHLKTTEKWQLTYFVQGVNKVYSGGKESLLEGGKESLPHNNNVNNNIDNNTANTKNFKKSLRERQIEFIKSLLVWYNTEPNSSKYPKLMISDFVKYWFETSSLKKTDKMRFEDQKFFDFGKRLGTWFRNTKDTVLQTNWENENKVAPLNEYLRKLLTAE